MAEIDDYLAGLDPQDARIVADAYAVARLLVPDVEQGMSYGMPALIHASRPLLSVMRAKGHFGIYPYSAAVVASLLETLDGVDGLEASKGTVRLPLGREIPEQVIRQLVLTRADEIRATNARKAPTRRKATTPTQ